MPGQGRLFYAVLDMGLGHATRSLPLLRAFGERGWQIWVGSSGRALRLLQHELPGIPTVPLPDYGLTYSRRSAGAAVLLPQGPRLLRAVRAEHALLGAFLTNQPVDLVISDHRYGCWVPGIPSWLLIHQLRFAAPRGFRGLEGIGARWQRALYRHFTGLLVPDLPHAEGGLVTGRMARPAGARPPVHRVGILSSLTYRPGTAPEVDLLVSISGPEPQRTLFEQRVLEQVIDMPGRRVVVLGRPESGSIRQPQPGLTIYDYADRALMEELVNGSRLVVARSGYSTLMELAETGRPALLVPTPGQTEQEYLARRLKRLGWFYSVPQRRLDLRRDLRRAVSFPGFPKRLRTADSVAALLKVVGATGR